MVWQLLEAAVYHLTPGNLYQSLVHDPKRRETLKQKQQDLESEGRRRVMNIVSDGDKCIYLDDHYYYYLRDNNKSYFMTILSGENLIQMVFVIVS